MPDLHDSTDVPEDSSAYVPNVTWHGPVQAFEIKVVISGKDDYKRTEVRDRIITENPQLIHRAIDMYAEANNAVVLERHFLRTKPPFEL